MQRANTHQSSSMSGQSMGRTPSSSSNLSNPSYRSNSVPANSARSHVSSAHQGSSRQGVTSSNRASHAQNDLSGAHGRPMTSAPLKNESVPSAHSASHAQSSKPSGAHGENPSSSPLKSGTETIERNRDSISHNDKKDGADSMGASDRSNAQDVSSTAARPNSDPGKSGMISREQIREFANSLLGPSTTPHTVDHAFLPQQLERRDVFKDNPNVYYLNGESLSRPLTIPPDIKKQRWIFVGIAFVIACMMLFFYFDNIVTAPNRAQEQMQEALSKDVSTNPPDMLKMLSRTDKKIKSTLNNTASKGGYTILDLSDPDSDTAEMNLVKIPATLTEEEGAALYEKGLSNLSALELVELLNGGWDLDVSRVQGLNISLHYADFKSTSPQTAIAQAIASEGLTRGKTLDSGDDDGFGNEFSNGTIMIKNVTYNWTVSSTYLKDVYSTPGIPENATYVGVRIVKQPS